MNQAPVGTLVRADERYTPSKQANTRKKNITIRKLRRQIIIATKETRHVVMKVTNITHTPYAFPSLVVCKMLVIICFSGTKYQLTLL